MTKHSKSDVETARANLLKWLNPGDTVHTVLDSVSRSRMSRQIRLLIIKCENGEAITLHPNHAVAAVLDYSQAKRGDGLVVGGCGMDVGFHLVHSLGYALWGKQASEGVGKEANALRKAIFKVTEHYMMQGGRQNKPDWNKPDREWFGAAGYALKHRWL